MDGSVGGIYMSVVTEHAGESGAVEQRGQGPRETAAGHGHQPAESGHLQRRGQCCHGDT